jgi:hypothetical protein
MKQQGVSMIPHKERTTNLKYFLLGLLVVVGVILLMGNGNSAPHYGRYQVSAWGTAFGGFSGGCGAFITDTATGKTKTAYMNIYGPSEGISIFKDNLGKNFYDIN